jgi:hypothetical protein
MYRNITLPVILYGCESWSPTLREERRLKVFKNRVLRRIFGPKRDEVTREWRKLHNEKLYDLRSSPNIIRVIKSRIRWAGNVEPLGDRKGVRFWWGDLRRKDVLEGLGTNGRILLKRIFRKWNGGA